MLNLIPGYGFDFKALVLLVFCFVMTIAIWEVQSKDILLFILLAYSGTILGVGVSYFVKGFQTFYLPTCILSIAIFLVTLTYAYTQTLHDRMDTINKCIETIRDSKLPQHKAFRHLGRNGLLALKEKLVEEEKSINMDVEKHVFAYSR